MGVNLSIKSVPDDWAEALRRRAERNHRSLQGELMALVEAAVQAPSTALGWAGQANPLEGVRRGTQTVEQLSKILDERRAQGLVPPPGLPTGTDIIRADRDSR
jgi:antitoxin FitA